MLLICLPVIWLSAPIMWLLTCRSYDRNSQGAIILCLPSDEIFYGIDIILLFFFLTYHLLGCLKFLPPLLIRSFRRLVNTLHHKTDIIQSCSQNINHGVCSHCGNVSLYYCKSPPQRNTAWLMNLRLCQISWRTPLQYFLRLTQCRLSLQVIADLLHNVEIRNLCGPPAHLLQPSLFFLVTEVLKLWLLLCI